jgi:predicted Zn-ribbon and HTH transcriptional regulator
MTTILDLKKRIRLLDEKEEICKDINKLVKRINIIEDSMERKDWYEQLEEVKEYYKQLNGEELVTTMSEINMSKPENIITPLLGDGDRPKDVEVIREIQEGKELHEEIKEMMKQTEEQEKTKQMEPSRRKKQEKEKYKKRIKKEGKGKH